MRSNPATAIVCLPLLDAAACDTLAGRLAAAAAWREGHVALPAQAAAVAHVIRSCAVADVVDDPALARALAFVTQVNHGLYGFDLTSVVATDPALAMRYRPGDHFDWHIDNGIEAVATRKLSFTVQLSDPSDYDGGDLEFAMYTAAGYAAASAATQAQAARQRGAIVIFPAFHLHRVSPVTRGERIALVGWVHGPRFR